MIVIKKQNPEHSHMYSHPCEWGDQCKHIKNPEHALDYLHEYKESCKWGKTCKHLASGNIDHCLRYKHEGVPNIREKCSNKHCTDMVNNK